MRARRHTAPRSVLGRAWLAMDALDDRASALRERIMRALGRREAPPAPAAVCGPSPHEEIARALHRERLLRRVAAAAEDAWGEWERDGDLAGAMARLRVELDTAAEFE